MQKIAQTLNLVVDEEVGKVILDVGHSRGRYSKYAKIVHLY